MLDQLIMFCFDPLSVGVQKQIKSSLLSTTNRDVFARLEGLDSKSMESLVMTDWFRLNAP